MSSKPHDLYSVSFRRLAMPVLWIFLLSPLAYQAWLGGWPVLTDVLFLFNCLNSILWLTLLHSLIRRPGVVHLGLAPLYLATAVNLFLLLTFGTRLSSGYVTIALTDHADVGDFMFTYARSLAFVALVLVVAYLPSLFLLRNVRQRTSPRLAVLAGVLLVATYGFAIGRSLKDGIGLEKALLNVAGHENSVPMGAVFQSALALKLHLASSELRALRGRHVFGASKAPTSDDEVYVWVIGESSRPANWSLFGYTRDTTPRIRATAGIIGLPDMITTAPHTAIAVPSMLSLRPITDWPSVQAQRSIIGAFSEAGFRTHWLSTQAADSWSGIVPQVAAEANRRRYFDGGFDGVLIDEVREILRKSPLGGKLLIVVQIKGSHFEYTRRYPPNFARFSTVGGARRDRIVDAYDNSILYTDWFLSALIELLAIRNTKAALFYASDHGENLLDDDKQLLGHAIGNSYDLPVAAFLWFSDNIWRTQHTQVANAKRNAAEALSLSNLSHSLLDLAGITAQGLDLRQSLFSQGFQSTPRSYIVRGELRHEVPALSSAAGASR